jgi:type IV secretory pathway TrbD component
MKEGPVETPLRGSLNRPQLIAGGDRELVLVTLVLGAVVIASGMSAISFAVGLGFVLVTISALRKMGSVDPLLRHVFNANRKYRDFYPAKSGRLVAGLPTPKKWIRSKYV